MLCAICISCPFILDEDGMSAVTMWITGDFEKDSGRKLLLSALKHVVSIIYSLFCSSLLILSTHHLVPIRECFRGMIYKLTYTVFIRCLCLVNRAFKNINSSIPSILTPAQDFFVKSYIASLKFFDGMPQSVTFFTSVCH